MADAQIKITADTRDAERALGSLSRQLDNIAGIVIGGGIGASFIKIASDAQELTNKLISVSSNMGEANAKFYQLAAIAQSTGSNLGGTIDLFQKLAQSSTFAGSSTEALGQVTSNFNKTLQISGASGASAASALYQFAQAMSKGSLNGDEFRAQTEANGYFIKILEKNLGLSNSQLRQMAEDGLLSAAIVGKALYENTKISEDYAKTVRTIPQAFENLTTSLTSTIKTLDDASGASKAIVAVLEAMANNMPALIGLVTAFFTVFAVSRIAAITLALRGMAVALATATGGVSLLVGAAAGILAWMATGKAIDEATKKTKENNKQNKAGLVITQERSKVAEELDKELRKQIATTKSTNDQLAQATGMKDLQLDVEIAIGKEREKYASKGQKMLAVDEASFRVEQIREILYKERVSTLQQILKLESETYVNSIADQGARQVTSQLEAYRLSVTKETYAVNKDKLKLDIEQAIQSKALAGFTDAAKSSQIEYNSLSIKNLDNREEEFAVAKARQSLGYLFTKDMEAQVRLGIQFNQNTQQALALETQRDLLRGRATNQNRANQIQTATGVIAKSDPRLQAEQTYQTELAAINEAIRNERIYAEAGLNNDLQTMLDARTQLDLTYARNKELLTQEYNNRELTSSYDHQQALLSNEQKYGEIRLKQAGVTNQAVLDSVKANQANAVMIQQGGVVAAQGMLGALDSVMGAMGAQSEKAFKAHKALAVAQAVISTYQAAASAIAFPPGPPISLIYVAGAIAAGFAQVNAIKSQQYTGRALGGPVSQGRTYMVGEQGPEMFTPTAAGNITPNNQMTRALGGPVTGGRSYIVGEQGPEMFTPGAAGNITPNNQMTGGTTNVNFTIVANDTTGFDQLLTSRRGMIQQIVSDAMLEKGQRM